MVTGDRHRSSTELGTTSSPVRVRDHDFPDEELGKITPYGVYDIAANRGLVSVGTSRDTAAFAVNALRLWWQREGALRYPGARRLLRLTVRMQMALEGHPGPVPPLWRVALFGEVPPDQGLQLSPATTAREASAT